MSPSEAETREDLQSDVSIKDAFVKQTHFKQLADLRHRFVALNVGNTKWIELTDLVKVCMERSWSLLVLKVRYQCTKKEYLEVYPRTEVFNNIFKWLQKIADVLALSKEIGQTCSVEDVSWMIGKTIDAIHVASGKDTVRYRPVLKPTMQSDHEKSFWTTFEHELTSQEYGKIVVAAWETPGMSELCHGHEIELVE